MVAGVNEDLLARLYQVATFTDSETTKLLSIKDRQLRNLLGSLKLQRFGPGRLHRINCQSIRQYLNLPEVQPINFGPWRGII
jgi:hypothetical protein